MLRKNILSFFLCLCLCLYLVQHSNINAIHFTKSEEKKKNIECLKLDYQTTEKELLMYVTNSCSTISKLSKKILILKAKNLEIKKKTILNTKGTIVQALNKKVLFILLKTDRKKKATLSWKLID